MGVIMLYNIAYFPKPGGKGPLNLQFFPLYAFVIRPFLIYEVCLKSIGTVCFAQTTLATVIKALFFKMAQCLVVVKM